MKSAFDVREALWKLRPHVWVALLAFVLVPCAALIGLRMTESRYESHIIVAIVDAPAFSEALEPLVRSNMAGRRETYALAVSRLDNMIHSERFLAQVAQRTGLAHEPDLLQEGAMLAQRSPAGVAAEDYAVRRAAGRLQAKIRVDRVGSPYVRVTALDNDAATAQRLAAAVGEVLFDESRQTNRERSGEREEFSTHQIELYQQKLRVSEDSLRRFEEKLIERRASLGSVTSANLDIARSQRLSVDGEIAQVREGLRADSLDWRSRSGGAEPPALQGRHAQELESLLGELELAHVLATLRSVAGNEDAAALRARIGDTRQRLFTEYEKLAGEVAGVSSDADRDLLTGIGLNVSILRGLERKRNQLAGLIESHVRELKATPGDQLQLEALRDDVQMQRDVLAALRKEARSSQFSQAMEAGKLTLNIEIVEHAQLPLAPVWPDRKSVLGGAALLGALLAAGVVMLIGRLGASITTLQEAELEVGAPVLGTLPRISGWHPPGSYLERNWAWVSILLVLLGTLVFHVVHPGRAAGGAAAAVHHGAAQPGSASAR